MFLRKWAKFQPVKAAVVAALLMVLGCGSAAAQGNGAPVWNQAYQENYERDTIKEILAGARNAYVLLDPFDEEWQGARGRVVRKLQAKGNRVAAYISIGTAEDWRDDFTALTPFMATRPWGEWPGEHFIATLHPTVLDVMKRRVDRIAAWDFDWVEFDNMDWAFDRKNLRDYALKVTPQDAAAYFRALCSYVHQKGMRCMAKSSVLGAEHFDGVTYESYPDDISWWDEDGALRFAKAGKPVVIVHYDTRDCRRVYDMYRAQYGRSLSFLCEDPAQNGYVRFP